jgi:hypothetical protein
MTTTSTAPGRRSENATGVACVITVVGTVEIPASVDPTRQLARLDAADQRDRRISNQAARACSSQSSLDEGVVVTDGS